MIGPNPVAFTVFGLAIYWYGIFIALAIVIGLLIAIKRAPRYGIDSDIILDFFLFMMPAVIIGARVYYVLFSLDYYLANPLQIFGTRNGGLAIHGGIIAGVLVAFILCRVKKIRLLTFLDVLVPGLPLGQALGRWGNYFNQEAYGIQTELAWAITVNDPTLGLIKVHPTFLYESVWNFLIFGFLFYYEKKIKKVDGELFFVYLGLYSIGRFFIEGLRTDSLMFFNLRIAQLISVAAIILGFAGILLLRKNSDKKI